MVLYVISSILALGCVYLGYVVLLKKEKNFGFIRFYFLMGLILGLGAPALHIDWGIDLPETEKIEFISNANDIPNNELVEKTSIAVYENDGIKISDILLSLYIFIFGFLLFRFGRNIFSITRQLGAWDGRTFRGLKVLKNKEQGNPYSFFSYVFVDLKDLDDPDFQKSVIPHEMAHYQELHTLDVIFTELICCIFWFNPFTWLLKSKIIENHEYLADAFVIDTGVDVDNYSRQLINYGDQRPVPIISGFSFIKTKNRINMLYTENTSIKLKSFRIGMAMLLMVLVFTVSSFSSPNLNETPLIVIVDAGHGGRDTGPLNEKEVNLEISQQLKTLSSKKVEIILIREGDEFLSLKDRLDFARGKEADLFLSLHSNSSTDPSKKGVEAYYSPKSKFFRESLDFSKILVENQVSEVTERGEVKEANFKILRDLPMPGVLLELGYLSNTAEAAKLRDPDYQKSMAKAIYNGLEEIRSQRK